MERGEKRCEHPGGCDITRDLTADHFTPRCVGKLLGWKRKQLNAPENIQWLCWPHHQQKDKTTPEVKTQLKFQLSGGYIKFGQHV